MRWFTLSLLVALLLVGWASGACKHGNERQYRSVTCPINRMMDPVCASDGCSYINRGAFECAKKDDPELTVVSRGMCVEPEA